jgi:CDP-glycerol glycerophosphotransferase (TagB/SpsB family)
LFGGALRPFDETSLLEMLDEAITEGKLSNTHIIYRPHPSRNARIKEKSFFDCDFKHITFDEELKDTYVNRIEKQNRKVDCLPDLQNYMDLYNSIDAIISPFSSVMIEAALFGKPVLGLACDDGIHFGYSSTKEIATREHFKILKEFDWFIQCNEKDELIDDCKKLLEITNSPNIGEKIKKDIGQIVYHDDKEFSERLLEVVNSQK